jgi:heme oxygenase
MSSMLLDGHELHFYQWEGDVKEKLDKVRKNIDSLATTWSREEKDECVKETLSTFKDGGSLLSYIARPPGQRPPVK